MNEITRRQNIDAAKARMDRAFVTQADCEAKTIDAEASLDDRKKKQEAAEREVDAARKGYFAAVNAPEAAKPMADADRLDDEPVEGQGQRGNGADVEQAAG